MRSCQKMNTCVYYLISPTYQTAPALFKHIIYANNKTCHGEQAVTLVKSPLVIRSAWCFTCRVPELPSVRVQRHTQNRRRYSLNSPSQGGGPAQRKKQNDRIRNQRQIHSGEGGGGDLQLYKPTETATSPLSHKTQPYEKITYPHLLCGPECTVPISFV